MVNELSNQTKLAIVAALEREVRSLGKGWLVVRRQCDGREFKFFERNNTALVCGGIGAEAARRATEAVINLYHPESIQSVGFAGALDSTLKVGNIFIPGSVIDAKDGSRIEIGTATGILLTVPSVAGSAEKANFAQTYGANAIDMEAAAVARVAQFHGIQFSAVKSISDENDFEMPPMERFINGNGQFRTKMFAAFVAVRPWLWISVARLAGKSAKASKALCEWLEHGDPGLEKLDNSHLDSHPIKGAHPQPRT